MTRKAGFNIRHTRQRIRRVRAIREVLHQGLEIGKCGFNGRILTGCTIHTEEILEEIIAQRGIS